jgi:hypothetical protein
MLDIHGTAFRELVRTIVQRILTEEGQATNRLYVVFETAFDVRYDSFLHELSGQDDIVVIVPDEWPVDMRSKITADCPACRLVSRKAAADFPLEGSLTVYPVASQDFAVKAALGIADTFETQWFNRCVRSGSRVQLVLSGLTRFTGKEPAAYVQRILSYYRTLLTYDVQIGPWENNNRTVLPPAAVPAIVPAQPSYGAGQVSVSRTIITASDLDTYAEGSTVPLAPGTMVTAYAEDEAEKRHIRFIRIQR